MKETKGVPDETKALDCESDSGRLPYGAGPAARFLRVRGAFPMLQGELKNPVIAYETWGELNAARDNAVLLFTGLSPSAHAASSVEDPRAGAIVCKPSCDRRTQATAQTDLVCPTRLHRRL